MTHEDIYPACKDRFDKIDRRLDEGDHVMDTHGEHLVAVEHDVSHLTKSLDGVTKALWGVALAGGAAVAAFVFWLLEWAIQHK